MTSMYRLCTWRAQRDPTASNSMYKAIMQVDAADVSSIGDVFALAVWDLSYCNGLCSNNYRRYYSRGNTRYTRTHWVLLHWWNCDESSQGDLPGES